MLEMIGRLFKPQTYDPKRTLETVLGDIVGEDVVSYALDLCADHNKMEEFLLNNNVDPQWDEEYVPGQDEMAHTIFGFYLENAGRRGSIDWADGYEIIIAEYDKLLLNAGGSQLTESEREEIVSRCAELKRGESYMKLWNHLHTLIAFKGYVLDHLESGQDTHFPVVLSPEVHKKWESMRFSKKYPVI